MKLDGGGPGRGILREIYGLGTGQADRSAGPFYGCRSVSGKGVIRPSGRKGGHWGERLEKIIIGRAIAKVVKIR